MNILINASNLSGGGGVQVADSVIRLLNKFPQHNFTVVYPSSMDATIKVVKDYPNVVAVRYNYPPGDIWSFISNRNTFLDSLVSQNMTECVLTLFGPMKWRPRCKHICGFAMSQLVLKDSPFFSKLRGLEKLKWMIRIKTWEMIFRRSSKIFYTENEFISQRLRALFKGSIVHTITNYYNQIFDNIADQEELRLPDFNGFQMLDIASYGLHKNQEIALDATKILRKKYPEFKFRFVFTIKEDQFPQIPNEFEQNFLFLGYVNIRQCPSLYRQVDASFQPTLMECFTATYVESMRAERPIITTNLGFAHSLCADAAVYYEAMNPESAAETIYKLATNAALQKELVAKGIVRLKLFDNQLDRVNKLISLCEN